MVSLSQYYFTYGFNNQFIYPLFSGAAVVLNPRRRKVKDFVECLHRYNASLAFSVPSALSQLIDYIEKNQINAPSALRAIISAGEPLPISITNRLEDLWGVPVFNQIGSTEVGNAFCANGFARNYRDSVGLICPGYRVELRPIPEASYQSISNIQDDRRIGAVWVSSPTIPDTVITTDGRQEILIEGWLETKDYGYWNEQGGLVILGRIDDFVHVGAISMSAVEIESAIRELESVMDCAVLSILVNGVSTLVALIVSNIDRSSPSSYVDVWSRQLRDSLEAFQIPKQWILVDIIPRTASGKIIRYRLDSLINLNSG
ncbi:class I adenylate-forming enzyme family protein [Photorhabdus temperata]|uniref:class I adenylate-forming enzyme family protein n=1 Tax=Photorhabdus temperata TaxID=574560 RepID=UPI0022ABC7E1|nr:fatty acid--CoA ligase family protein [Photorhabdus temperata]